MRSVAEIQFRLRQEIANAYLLWRNSQFRGAAPERLALPDPRAVVDGLRGSAFATRVQELAGKILAHEFPVLGIEIKTGPQIDWRRDYIHGKASEAVYFKRVPYLNFDQVGDHKLVWELNRHQHLVLLAQAYLFTEDRAYLREIEEQLESWWMQNPFQKGINWASALEVAFRALSWVWVFHLVGQHLSADIHKQLLTGLYQHGLHLAENLSVYFSPNTHLLGEAVALYALGVLFPSFPGAIGWQQRSRAIVLEQLTFQVKPDGSHFEQSSYYHVYAVDFFLLFLILDGKSPEAEETLSRMGEYLEALLGNQGQIDFWGDDDGGRLFHPYGDRSRFGQATLATVGLRLGNDRWKGRLVDRAEQACWWLGAEVMRLPEKASSTAAEPSVFRESGAVFLQAGRFSLQMDCGPFGFGGSGHSHSDTLAITLRLDGRPALIDPGTYTYISDIEQRNWFRGSAAHNTVRVDGLDQAQPVTPFRWADKPEVELLNFAPGERGGFVEARCEYRGVRHTRRVLLTENELVVLDEIDGPPGEHVCEQSWHFGERELIGVAASSQLERRHSWFSPAYGVKVQGSVAVVTERGPFPVQMAARIGIGKPVAITVEQAVDYFTQGVVKR